ncbi:SDR family NAD(P)-dependent oxidoreductase [Lentzea flava]|uniref:SDR family NAD(P)-dependent oxidoreductase n=1 Tax=Lentzea flava TaxID=103732 RepID=UPI0034D4726A
MLAGFPSGAGPCGPGSLVVRVHGRDTVGCEAVLRWQVDTPPSSNVTAGHRDPRGACASRHRGRIINIGSIKPDRTPFPGHLVCALTKCAVSSLTRGLAHELAPRGIDGPTRHRGRGRSLVAHLAGPTPPTSPAPA